MLVNVAAIREIMQMLDSGMSPHDVSGVLNDREVESLAADHEDDSDEAIIRRCGIYADDTVDSRGEPLRPRIDPESGEPWWM